MKVGTGIRRGGAGDEAAIAGIYVETWRAAYPGLLPDRVLVGMSVARQQAAWRHTLASQRGPEAVWVAEDAAGGVVGFASCGRARALRRTHAGEIFTLYVSPDHQGRGHGRGLLQGCLGHLRACGFDSAMVWVLAGNPSRFFYQAMGAARVAERTEPLWGTKLPEFAYGWSDLTRALRPDGPCAGRR